jgi:hypothetical protein
MDEWVNLTTGQRFLRLARRPSLAGSGLTERMRTTTFALLGITAAAGLGLVAIFSQQGWPLLSPSPIPSPSAGREAVDPALAVGRHAAGEGAGARPESGQGPRVVATPGAAPVPGGGTGAGVARRFPVREASPPAPGGEHPGGPAEPPPPTSPSQPSPASTAPAEAPPPAAPAPASPPASAPPTPSPSSASTESPDNGHAYGHYGYHGSGYHGSGYRGYGHHHTTPPPEPATTDAAPEPAPEEPPPPASEEPGGYQGHGYGSGHYWHH